MTVNKLFEVNSLVQLPVLACERWTFHYLSDTGMGTVLEQEQERDGRVVNRVIAYASKTLNES